MDNAVGGSGYNGALSPGSGSQMAQRIAKWKAGTMGSNPYYPNAPAAAAGADGNQDGQDLGDGQAAASAPRSSMANRVAAFRAANTTRAASLSDDAHITEEPVDADMEIADFVNGGLTPSTI